MKTLLIAFLLLPAIAAGEPLGRLFFTPQQRAFLDRLHRQQGKIELKGVDPSATGSVELKGGGKTLWTDGIPRYLAPGKKK